MTLTRRRQPARRAMVWRDMTTKDLLDAVQRLGGRCDEAHLFNALSGRVHPNEDVRRLLPVILGVPLEACFDAELLGSEYSGRRRGRTAAR